MARVIREKEMDVSQEALFGVIVDFEKYPEFITEVVAAKVMPGATKEKIRVQFELEVVKRFAYTLEFKIDGKEEVSWKLVESNFFKTNEGAWKLTSLGKNKTEATYELEVGFGFLVPGWITKKLTETSLPTMLSNFETRAKKVAKGSA